MGSPPPTREPDDRTRGEGKRPSRQPVMLTLDVDVLAVARAEAAAAGVSLSTHVNAILRSEQVAAGHAASARWLAEIDPGWAAYVEAAAAEVWAGARR